MEVQVRDSAGRVCGTLNALLLYYLGIKLLEEKKGVVCNFRRRAAALHSISLNWPQLAVAE